MPISRRHFFLGSLALPAFAAKKPPARPNLVFFLIDDLPAWTLGCYGNKEIRTPNIDLLSQTGTRFLNHFACAPAADLNHAVFLTGRTPMQLAESRATSIAFPLERALGYASEAANTDQAVAFLDAQTATKPFFLTVTHRKLRAPYDGVAQKYRDLYTGAKFEGYSPDPVSPSARTGKDMLSNIIGSVRKFAAALTELDDHVGVVMNKIRQKQLLENTLIVFSSTCGGLLGRRGLWDAGDGAEPVNVSEESINTPMIWSWLGKIPAVAVQVELISSYDFIPTVSEALSVDPGPGLCGKSYLWMATGKPLPKKQRWRKAVCGHLGNTDYARVERYKVVIRDGGKGPNETYDLGLDPHERTNEAANDQFADIRSVLGGEIAKWKSGYSS